MYLFTVFLPLLSFFTFLLLKNFVNKNFLIYFSVFNIFLSSFFSIFILNEIINTNNSINLDLFNWLSSGKLLSTWSLHFDFLTNFMIFFHFFSGFFLSLFVILHMGYMRGEGSRYIGYIYTCPSPAAVPIHAPSNNRFCTGMPGGYIVVVLSLP